jgi:hypothetical protein
MTIKIAALDMISAPNYYSYVSDNKWSVKSGNSVTLYGQLFIVDSLSERRYIPAAGATLQATFLRSDTPGTNTSRTLNKMATLNASDRSLFSLALSSSEVDGIVSGGITFTLNEGSSAITVWVMDWGIKKTNTSSGF